MKYMWSIMGFVFLAIVIVELVKSGTWNSLNALWMLVCFLQYDIKNLEEKVK